MAEKTDPYDALLATIGVLREGARYYEVLKVGDRLLLGDEERELNGPWYPVLLKNPGEVVKVADTSRFSFRRPIPRPTERILECMRAEDGRIFHPMKPHVWNRHPEVATGWLDAIDAQAAAPTYDAGMDHDKQAAEASGEKTKDLLDKLEDFLLADVATMPIEEVEEELREAGIDVTGAVDRLRKLVAKHKPTLPAAPGEGDEDAPEDNTLDGKLANADSVEAIALLMDEVERLTAERDDLRDNGWKRAYDSLLSQRSEQMKKAFDLYESVALKSQELTAERQDLFARATAAEAEVERWKQSFDGHVYVKNEEYAALVAERDLLMPYCVGVLEPPIIRCHPLGSFFENPFAGKGFATADDVAGNKVEHFRPATAAEIEKHCTVLPADAREVIAEADKRNNELIAAIDRATAGESITALRTENAALAATVAGMREACKRARHALKQAASSMHHGSIGRSNAEEAVKQLETALAAKGE